MKLISYLLKTCKLILFVILIRVKSINVSLLKMFKLIYDMVCELSVDIHKLEISITTLLSESIFFKFPSYHVMISTVIQPCCIFHIYLST